MANPGARLVEARRAPESEMSVSSRRGANHPRAPSADPFPVEPSLLVFSLFSLFFEPPSEPFSEHAIGKNTDFHCEKPKFIKSFPGSTFRGDLFLGRSTFREGCVVSFSHGGGVRVHTAPR